VLSACNIHNNPVLGSSHGDLEGEGEGEGGQEEAVDLSLYGLVWGAAATSAAGSGSGSDEGDEVGRGGGGLSSACLRLRRHPLKSCGGASAVFGSKSTGGEESLSRTAAPDRAVQILRIRGLKLAQAVAAFSTQHCCRNQILQLQPDVPGAEGSREALELEMELEAFACEWFVLAEVSLFLSGDGYDCGADKEVDSRSRSRSRGDGTMSGSGSVAVAVDWRALQPLCEVLDQLDMFAELGRGLQSRRAPPSRGHVMEGGAEPLLWTDFVALQEVNKYKRVVFCSVLFYSVLLIY
jgi:hypothetical protein